MRKRATKWTWPNTLPTIPKWKRDLLLRNLKLQKLQKPLKNLLRKPSRWYATAALPYLTLLICFRYVNSIQVEQVTPKFAAPASSSGSGSENDTESSGDEERPTPNGKQSDVEDVSSDDDESDEEVKVPSPAVAPKKYKKFDKKK